MAPGPGRHDDKRDSEPEADWRACRHTQLRGRQQLAERGSAGLAVGGGGGRHGHPVMIVKLTTFVVVENEYGFGVHGRVAAQHAHEARREILAVGGVVVGVLAQCGGRDDPRDLRTWLTNTKTK